MKLVGKILLYFFGSLIVVIIAAIVFHDSIISFVLKKVIADKSKGKVELTLESFHLDFESGLILIERPALKFSEVYMNETKSIRLKSIKYEKLVVDRLNLRALIFHREIVAERLLLDKPVFKLVEQDSETKSSFHPEKLLKVLNANPDMFSKLNIRVGEIKIHYGSIMLSEFATPGIDPGLVDFTIILEDFDTHPIDSTNQNRFFFSNEFKLILKNLHRELKSGYILDIDSALFSSKHDDLIIGGISLQPYFRYLDRNSIGIKAGKLVLHDISIEEIRGLEDLSLRSVILEDGEFVNFINVEPEKHNDSLKSKGLDQLAMLLDDFKLDTIMINDFNYYNVKSFKDTVISTDDINFILTGVDIDSSMFSDILRNVKYDEIRLRTGKFSLSKLVPEFKIDYEEFNYSNVNRELSIKGIDIHSDTAAGYKNALNLYIPELSVNGASFSHFQQGKRQNLSVTINNPNGNIVLDHFKKDTTKAKSKGQKKSISDFLTLDMVKLVGGNFNILKTDEFTIQVTGLGIDLEGIDLQHLENDSLNYESLSFGFNSIETYLDKQDLQFSSGIMDYNKPQFSIQDIYIEKSAKKGSGQLGINRISLSDFDFERLVFENELQTGRLHIDSPVLKTELQIDDKNQSASANKPFQEITIPFTIFSDSVSITNGKIDGKVDVKGDEIVVNADYDLGLGEIDVVKDELLIDLIERLGWKLDISNVVASGARHKLQIDKLYTDKYRSVFQIDSLLVSSDEAVFSDKLKIRSLNLPLLKIAGLNYNLLLKHDSIALSSIVIDNPYIDILLPEKKDQTKVITNKTIDLREYLFFSYDTVAVNSLFVKLEMPGDSSNATIKLDHLNFGHHFTTLNDPNLIEHLDFNFKSFLYRDSLHEQYLEIHDGFLDPRKKSLKIRGVQGSNIAREKGTNKEVPGVHFASEEIELSNIRLQETLPSSLMIDKLSFSYLDLDINQAPKDTSKKTDFKINLDIMRRFTKVMTRLSIDTTVLGEINVNIHSVKGSDKHTIKFDSIGLIIGNINVDTSMIDQDDPMLVRNIIIDLKGKTRITKDSLYELQTGRLHYNFPERRITIDSFYVVPRFDDDEFFKRAKFQTDRLKIFGRKIEIRDIFIKELLDSNYYHCGSVYVHNLNADIFRDKRFPIKPGTYKILPREQLKGLKSLITIDSINLIDSYLKYSEHDLKSDQPGNIFIDNINGTIYDLTNNLKPGERKNLKLEFSGHIMGDARMDAKIFFPLHDDSTAYWLSVKTETIDLTQLNSMTEHLLGIGILRGQGSVDAPFITANDSIATGNLVFRYKKVKLAMYNRKKAKLNQGFGTPLLNFLINGLVVKSNNPKFARKPRVGQVYFVRATEKGVVNYLWKGILTGLTSTLGFNNKEQRLERKEERKKK